MAGSQRSPDLESLERVRTFRKLISIQNGAGGGMASFKHELARSSKLANHVSRWTEITSEELAREVSVLVFRV